MVSFHQTVFQWWQCEFWCSALKQEVEFWLYTVAMVMHYSPLKMSCFLRVKRSWATCFNGGGHECRDGEVCFLAVKSYGFAAGASWWHGGTRQTQKSPDSLLATILRGHLSPEVVNPQSSRNDYQGGESDAGDGAPSVRIWEESSSGL